MSILIIAEHDNNNLKGSTLNTIAAGKLITGDITLLIAGSNIENVINESQSLDGVTNILKCDDPGFENLLAEDLSDLVLSVASDFTHILAPATTFGKNLMPRISAKLDTQQISDIISIESDDTFKRPIYAGSCIATVKSSDAIKVITVRSTAFDPATQSSNSANINEIGAISSKGNSKYISEELAQSDRPELTADRKSVV